MLYIRDAGHVYRVLNYTSALIESQEFPDKPEFKQLQNCIAVAACFHDVGIWLDRTMNYLEPSARHAEEWLTQNRHEEWLEPVTLMIPYHHKMTPYTGPHAKWVESFRKADLVDVSIGLGKSGVPRAFVREVERAFPYRGFHWMLVKGLSAYALRHPWNPLPMMRR